ncbi:MAG: DUF222 domain-containing protein [Gammaproteobacteria bacterium]|nr:DUF222 domain-containing protein [Gammaproteobacteria bacterium]
MKSPAHWLNYYCGIDLGAAREKVRVAKSLQNFPGIDETFRTGEIIYSKVRAMTRLTKPEHETMLLQVARHGTAQHIEQLVRKYRRTERLSETARDRNNCEAREFVCHFDEDGMLVLRGRLTPEDGAVFLTAMDAMVSALNPPVAESEESEEPEESEEEIPVKTFPQKRADTLLALAEQAMSTMDEGLRPLSSAEKYQVMVHIERERVAEGVLHTDRHQCSVECGTDHFPLSAATTRRLCCDASIVIVLEDSRGDVLNVGRRTRTIPPSIRRALQVRDGGGCSAI